VKRFECSIGVVFLLLVAAITFARPVSSGEHATPPSIPGTVVLISLDGTRPAELNEAMLPSLAALGRKGARAEALVPVDPTNTFPNHVSLVTGVWPEEHRMVNNQFIDPVRGSFSRKRKKPHSWIESEPIWSIAERHGLPTASFYWVGSEGPWKAGPGPREARKFSSRTLEKTKVNQILKWLAISDPLLRPRLITCWFHGADHAGHVSGPGTKAVAKSLSPQNTQIARLVDEMEKRGLFESTTLIFVSDHGMATARKRVNLGRELRRAGLEVSLLGIGGFSIGVFDDGTKSELNLVRAAEIAQNFGLEAWPSTQAPAEWHVDDPRFGDFVVRAPIGTAIVGTMTMIDGFHGYDSREPAMAGLLVARGRGVEVGAQLGRVSSLSIAPTVLRLLGLPVPTQMKSPPIAALTIGVGESCCP
jgi:hypothetical protein